MLVAYSFVFNVIFKARWAGTDEGDGTFVLMLYAGMLVHGLVAECLIRSPGLIIATPSYVKKIVFPLEVVPLVCVAVALFNLCTGIGLLLIAKIAIMHSVSWVNIWALPVLLPIMLITLGITYLFSALGVYLRDLSQLTTSLAMILLFFSPVFYPVSSVPQKYRVFFEWSPLTSTIENMRKVFLFNQLPDFAALSVSMIVSLILCWAGYFTFQRMRMGFADVL